MPEGRKPKDLGLTFNPEKKIRPSAADLRKARMEKARLEAEERRRQRELDRMSNQLAGLSERIGKTVGDKDEEGEDEEKALEGMAEPDDSVNAKSAYQMLQDMRYVYRKVRGRKKLKDLVEGDDKQFVFMVKELMKIESALLAAKIRKDGDGPGVANQNFFVVLKGLEEEKKILDRMDKTIDVKQINQALNPTGV